MCGLTRVLAVAVYLAGGPLASTTTHTAQFTECRLQETGVYVSISSEAEFVNNGTEAIRWLEVNWYGVSDFQEEDWVGLWDHDPTVSLDDPLVQLPASGDDGVIRTDQRWDDSLIPTSLRDTADSCLPYWTGYIRDGTLLYSACLMLRPHWLSSLRSQLSTTRLTKVALPGTHDAGSSGHFGLGIIGDEVGRWTFTQDESLWQQLVLGVRYMDMRIAYYPQTEEKFFVNHGDVRIAPLQSYIDNVVDFMKQTEEIVIFDIHGLEIGFDGYPERHQELITLLELSFMEWMATNDLEPDPTLGDLWASGSRLVVTYPSSEVSLSPYLWHTVYHLWGNVNNLSDLEVYLYTGIPQQSDRGSLWSAMAEFTPSSLDVVANRWGGLRGAAAITNAPVTRWFRQDWWNQVNIVAMDYIPASDVVSVAVEANKIRSQLSTLVVSFLQHHEGNVYGLDLHFRTLNVSSPQFDTFQSSHRACCQYTKINTLQRCYHWSSAAVCADLVGAGGVGVRVWPTVKASPHSIHNKLHFRLLQVNWDAEEIYEGDWLGVFPQDPRPPHSRPPPTTPPTTPHRFWQMPHPLHWDTPYASRGTITTNITLPRIELSVLARGGCVGVYAGFIRNGVCVAAECLAAYPSWLFDHRQVLGNRSLRSLVLPGTHNAGSYSLKDQGDVVSAWVVCQDEDIISQLLYGNRYLDLRVAYYPDTQELLWINHDLVRWRPLLEVLTGVRGFLAISPDPLIIDIHRTPIGFDLPEAMPLLLSLMNETLGSHFLHNRYGSLVSLDQIWKIGKRVIFTFADADAADKHEWVWPPLPQAWANAQILDDLRAYLDAQMNKRVGSPRLWAAMAHLTPTLWDMILRSHVGVRGLADRVNFSITRWLRQRWAHMTNIVASDFFRGNNVINVAIRTNLALSVCRPAHQRTVAIPVVPVAPQRHPITFRRSTGFRIVSETRRPVYSEITTQPMSSATTLPPLFKRIYSPISSEESLPKTSTPPVTDTVNEETKYTVHSSADFTWEMRNASVSIPTESPLYPLIRAFTASTVGPSMSADNANQHDGNRKNNHTSYPPVTNETSKGNLYISEPEMNIYDTLNERTPTADSQGVTDQINLQSIGDSYHNNQTTDTSRNSKLKIVTENHKEFKSNLTNFVKGSELREDSLSSDAIPGTGTTTSSTTRDETTTPSTIREETTASSTTKAEMTTSSTSRDEMTTLLITNYERTTSSTTKSETTTSSTTRDEMTISSIIKDESTTSLTIKDEMTTSSIKNAMTTLLTTTDEMTTSSTRRDEMSTSSTTNGDIQNILNYPQAYGGNTPLTDIKKNIFS